MGGKLLDEKIAVIMPAKNEEPRIKEAILQFKGYVDEIIVIDDWSTDRTVEIAEKYADKVVRFPKKLNKLHQSKLYNFGKTLTDAEWILNPDCDERYSEAFLKKIRYLTELSKEVGALAFRFPRLNLVTEEEMARIDASRLTKTEVGWVKDYPDYQVRMVFREIVEWRGEPHCVPYSILHDKPIDKVSCFTVNEHPIIHLPRRSDIKRPWWEVI